MFFDGLDLRNSKRWSRNVPVEVVTALEPGEPSSSDGVRCVDCGNRFRTEFDHLEPTSPEARPPTPTSNPDALAATRRRHERDRRAGKLEPPEPRPRVHDRKHRF